MLHVEPREGRTILELLREKGILLESPCNGKGLCGKCKVRILKGEVSARSAQEENFLTPEERDFGIRLACLTVPLEEVELDPLGLLREGGGGVLGSGERPDIPLAPVVTEEPIHLAPSSFEDGRSMCAALEVGGDLPLSLMRELPALEENREVCLVRYGGAPVALQTDGTLYGLAVDIGTTTVAVALLDLRTGARLAEDGFVNPQKAFGLDVLSRIHYDIEHPGGVLELQRVLVERLEQSARTLTESLGRTPETIYEVVVGGNSTMLHALLGIPLASLGQAPYRSVFSHAVTVLASELGLALHPQARVYCIPSVSAYIGGDIVSGALASRLDQVEDTVLFLDIGTNGEMILSQHGRMYACSCAAGPALEGMNISCGMRAEPGAVEHVRLDGGCVELGVIGGGASPRGLCGSGLLEAISQAVSHKLIAKSGRLTADSPLTDTDERGKWRLVLDAAHGLYVTQADIRQVQLCKGAILSGILTLLKQLKVEPEAVDRVLVAGQFGKHLDPASLTGAGILPACLREKISYIGNSSMTGAELCLLSGAERQRAEALAQTISYVELSISDGYEELFTRSLQFGGL